MPVPFLRGVRGREATPQEGRSPPPSPSPQQRGEAPLSSRESCRGLAWIRQFLPDNFPLSQLQKMCKKYQLCGKILLHPNKQYPVANAVIRILYSLSCQLNNILHLFQLYYWKVGGWAVNMFQNNTPLTNADNKLSYSKCLNNNACNKQFPTANVSNFDC